MKHLERLVVSMIIAVLLAGIFQISAYFSTTYHPAAGVTFGVITIACIVIYLTNNE